MPAIFIRLWHHHVRKMSELTLFSLYTDRGRWHRPVYLTGCLLSLFLLSPLQAKGADPVVLSPLSQEEKTQTSEEHLTHLFTELKEAKNIKNAKAVAEEIKALWNQSGSATQDLLLARALKALEKDELPLARRLFNHSLRLFPDHARAWVESAHLYYEEKNFRQALEHINKALVLEPRHFRAYFLLGLILESLDEKTGAYQAYQEVLRLYPQNEQAKKRLQLLEKHVKGRAL